MVLLDELKANMNSVDRWGGTPLRDAVREGHKTVAHMLYKAGGELGYTEAQASAELCEYAKQGDLPSVQLLLRCGAQRAGVLVGEVGDDVAVQPLRDADVVEQRVDRAVREAARDHATRDGVVLHRVPVLLIRRAELALAQTEQPLEIGRVQVRVVVDLGDVGGGDRRRRCRRRW